MSHPRIEVLTAFRTGLVVIPLLTGTVAPAAVGAQQSAPDIVSSSTTFTQPLARGIPEDLTQRVMLDPSPHAFAPWVAIGLRWAWDATPNGDAYPIGAVGLRLQRQSLRMALGVSRDAAYLRTDGGDHGASPVPPSGGAVCAAITCQRVCPDGWVLDPAKGLCMPPGPVRAGYAMQPVAEMTWSADWNAGPVAVGVETGWRLGGPENQRLSYRGTVATPIAPMFALVAGVDRRYDRAFAPGAMHLTLGLQRRWAFHGQRPPAEPARTPRHAVPRPRPSRVGEGSLIVHRVPNGIRLSFVATSARRVEVRSDLTGWTAVPMEHADDGQWQLDLAASPGVHQLAVRVDGGGWRPPSGLPAGPDGYGGTAGFFVVEP